MKKLVILFLLNCCANACILDKMFPTRYYDPVVVDTSESDGVLASRGDTCWFYIEYTGRETKFQGGIVNNPFKYVIEIEGAVVEGPVSIERDALWKYETEMSERFPEFFEEEWLRAHGRYGGTGLIVFAVPANFSNEQRKVEAKLSIQDLTDESWSEWETVFSAIQEGR